MIGKKTWFVSVAGVGSVAAMSFGAAQACATAAKHGFAQGCVETPGCMVGGNGRAGGTRICCDAN